ncbi:MAG: dihydropteroate synthase [Deltaproteobacteria bacterium]|nr:dihydropteroate synthase [Deltaproteobacteria bacterium]
MRSPIEFRSARFDWSRPYIMGVVNVTPDSFSDGGRLGSVDAAVAHGEQLVADGADLLDIGGEATNPRAQPVSAAVELARIAPVIAALAKRVRVPISVDTTKAAVAAAAIDAGAEIVNDVAGGRFDPEIAAATAAGGAVYVCGHLRGASLAEVFAAEEGVPWTAVADELAERLAALPPGLRARTWIDPGLGFGKGSDPAANLALCRHAGDLARRLGCPVVVGPSRKRFLRRVLDADRAARDVPAVPWPPLALDAATVGACLASAAAGAHVLRVHDAGLLRAALIAYAAVGHAEVGAA